MWVIMLRYISGGTKLDSVTGVEVQEIIIIQIFTQPISIYSHMQAGYVYAYSSGSKRKKKENVYYT